MEETRFPVRMRQQEASSPESELIEVEAQPFQGQRIIRTFRTPANSVLSLLGGAVVVGFTLLLAAAVMAGIALVVTAGHILRRPFGSKRRDSISFLSFPRWLLKR